MEPKIRLRLMCFTRQKKRKKKWLLDFCPMTSQKNRAVAGGDPGGVTASGVDVADARTVAVHFNA